MVSHIKYLIVSVLACAVYISSAHAAVSCTTNSCTGFARELIQVMFPTDNGGQKRLVLGVDAIKNNISCSTNVYGNIFMEDSAVFDENYALLMTAFSANEKIILRVDTNIQQCTIMHVRLTQ